MLKPFLLIGVGGSGGKTLRGIKYQLELKLQQLGWKDGIPAAWQFLHFDTPTVQDGTEFPAPFLPRQDYRGLVSTAATYEIIHGTITNAHSTNRDLADDIGRQLPDPRFVRVDVTKGAGQYRAVGRAVALAATKDIAAAARAAINRLNDATALAELQTLGARIGARDDGGDTSPTVIAISSIAGGSGAGQFLDVIEVVKSTVKQYQWANEFFSILYAPDVFDQLGVTAGMPGNALAAIAETMNGYWTDTPSPATIELLRTQGVAPSYGSAMDRVGAAYPFIVGRSNSKVTFEDQTAVYNAVATSLTAWITDERVQADMVQYSSGNWQARSAANVLPDTTGLRSPSGRNSPPFSSIGFGRVTLGRERFLEYAAERLARSAVDRMLLAHIEDDPMLERMTEREHVERTADSEYQRFLRDLRLNEETEAHNDVTEALRDRAELDALLSELYRRADEQLNDPGSLDRAGGADLTTWTDRMMSAYATLSPRLLERDKDARQHRLDEWIRTQPSHILTTVAEHVAGQGLPVAIAMLARLERALQSTIGGLEAESRQYREWADGLRTHVADDLRTAIDQQSIRPDSDAFRQALARLQQGMGWESEARLRRSAADLLTELRDTLLVPLQAHLQGSLIAIRQRVTARKTADDRENDYEFWPTRVDATVPRKYYPAPNERLLLDAGDYPAEFERLVLASVEGRGKYQDAVLEVIRTMLVGTALGQEETGDALSWSLIANPRAWKPKVTAEADLSRAAQTPRFEVATEPEQYATRAREWMKRDGTPFNAYIGEDLRNFFDEDQLAPDVFAARRERFREQLQSALGAAEPLVKLNPALLRTVHDKAVNESTSLVFSSIPFREGTKMHAVTKSVLAQMGVWDDATSDSWFKDQRVDSIEVFAMSGFPYEPVVMDSVMEPITRGWLEQSNLTSSRDAFWQFKRSRLLGESIPADPTVISAMIRGWYVAKTLGRLSVDDDRGEKGPRLGVWDPKARTVTSFPYPLLSGQEVVPPLDYPGVVLESLSLAMALSNNAGTLEPLLPYQVLAALGGSGGSSRVLGDWIQHGLLDPGADQPAEARAGTASGTLESRRDAVQRYLSAELDSFERKVVRQADLVSVYSYPVTWEMRDRFIEELRELISFASSTVPEDSGV